MLFGIFMGLLASASWAGANVFVQRSARQVGPVRALVWAQAAGIAALAPLALWLDGPKQAPDRATLIWGVAAAIAAIVAYPCLFYATERGRLSVVVPIMSSWSVVAAGVSLGFLGERLRLAHVVGAALVVVGVLIVSAFSQDPDQSGSGSAQVISKKTLSAAVGGALGFGLLIPAIDRLAPVAGRLGAIPVVFVLELVFVLPLVWGARIDIRPPRGRAWISVLAAGLLETVGFVWISLGVARAPVSVVSPLAGLASALTVIFAWVVLGERPRPPVLLGAGLACAGVVTLAL